MFSYLEGGARRLRVKGPSVYQTFTRGDY